MAARNRLLDYAYWRRMASEAKAAAAKCSEERERAALERFAVQYEQLAAYGESRASEIVAGRD